MSTKREQEIIIDTLLEQLEEEKKKNALLLSVLMRQIDDNRILREKLEGKQVKIEKYNFGSTWENGDAGTGGF